MKLNASNTPVALSGMADTVTGFKIEANAKAFRALSSTLYKDQIGSVLREIVCNGMDANKMSGSTIPVEVKLPNPVNPTFYVRDTGPGLSEEDVKSLYTTYFASTKDQSNDQIGAFGLGSKSPFAYTDSFTVVSAHGGMKKTYAAFLSEAGDPSILKVTEEPVSADWEHGLEIGFPVKPKDFAEFEQKALTQLEWLDPLPTLKGVVLKLEKPALAWSFGAFSQRQSTNCASLSVVMGGVAYSLNNSDVTSLSAYLEEKGWLHTRNLCLTVPLGSAEVALSREGLSMTEYTLQSLSKIIKDNINLLREQLAAEEALLQAGRSFAETRAALAVSDLIPAAMALIGWGHQYHNPNNTTPAILPAAKLAIRVSELYHYLLSNHGLVIETFLSRKPTQRGFILEQGTGTQVLFGQVWDELVWVINDKDYPEASVRDRVRQIMVSDLDKRMVIVLSRSSGENPALAQVVGVPMLQLSEVALPKKGSASVCVRPEFGQTALLADRKKLDMRVNHDPLAWGRVEVTPPGPLPELEEGQVGYVVRIDLSRVSNYNSVAANIDKALNGLNSALRRIGAPEADSVYAIHRKTDLKKALAIGYRDLSEVLRKSVDTVARNLATAPVRQSLMTVRANNEYPLARFLPYNGPSILLRVLGQFPEAAEILGNTWILRDIRKLYQPDFVQTQEDYICLYNLIRGLSGEIDFSVIANAEKPSESIWPEQEALFQKLDLPELLALGTVIPDFDIPSKARIILEFLKLLRLKPEPTTVLAAVA